MPGIKLITAMLTTLALAGCVDREMFVKQGVTYDRYERDFVGCATQATQAVPTNTQIAWAPYVGIYSADTNAPLRQKSFDLCMRDLGYAQVTIPYCEGSALEAANQRAALPQDREHRMRVSPASCYTLKADGSPFLFTPGT